MSRSLTHSILLALLTAVMINLQSVWAGPSGDWGAATSRSTCCQAAVAAHGCCGSHKARCSVQRRCSWNGRLVDHCGAACFFDQRDRAPVGPANSQSESDRGPPRASRHEESPRIFTEVLRSPHRITMHVSIVSRYTSAGGYQKVGLNAMLCVWMN